METRIKIAYIMPSMARGGAERFLLDLLSQLDRQLFAPMVILFKDRGPWYEELTALRLPVFTLTKKTWLGLGNIRQIYNLLKAESPQIVHTQLGGDIRGRLAAKLAGIKIIISTEQNINRAETWYRRWLKIITSVWAKNIVAISTAVAADMRRRYFLPARQCRLIIPNGLNLDNFPYQEERPRQTPLLVGAVGRLTAQKGFDLLIAAWKEIKPSGVKLLIAGDGAERNNLQKQIDNSGLKDQIKLVGDLTVISSFYRRLNLFIMPSRWEGLGIAALEAGACGVPVVASDADGLKDIVKTETGSTFPAGDIKSLGQTLTQALAAIHSKETKLKQRRLRALIVNNFTIAAVSAAYTDLYLDLWRQTYENTPSQ